MNSERNIRYSDVIMGARASQITDVLIVYSTVCSGADHRKHQSSASLAFVRGIHRGPVNSPHKGPVTRKMFPFDDVFMKHINEVYHSQKPAWNWCLHSLSWWQCMLLNGFTTLILQSFVFCRLTWSLMQREETTSLYFPQQRSDFLFSYLQISCSDHYDFFITYITTR